MAVNNFTMDMFNSIRNDPASGLKDLPEATKTNLSEIKTILDRNPDLNNAYVKAMVVRIGRAYFKTPRFENKLARFKKGLNPMGHLVQNVHFDPIHAEDNFDGNGTNPLGRRDMSKNVNVAYHSLNYQPRYAITIDRVGMMNAMGSWDDLDRYWAAQMQAMYTGATIDEYVAQRKVIADAIAATSPGSQLPSAYIGDFKAKDEASGKAFCQALKYVINDLEFPHQYNQAGVVNVTPRNELYLILNKDVEPNIDVYTLASLFHTEFAKIQPRIVTIDTFSDEQTSSGKKNDNVLGLLCTADFFQFYDTLNTVRPMENGQGLFTNFFFHPWETIQLNPFATCVVLRSGNAPA